MENLSDFVRVTAASHQTFVADPHANARAAIDFLANTADSQVVVFGELSLTGYSCGDLFAQDRLIGVAAEALQMVASATEALSQIVVVGLPLRVEGRLYNAAAVIWRGDVIALIPKQYLPNYQEFYESRWFTPADGREPEVAELPGLGEIPFGTDLLVRCGPLTIGVELCEDLWMPVPPSSLQAMAGANLLLNLSASNELVGKAAWRELLVRSQSGRCLAAYAYASAGPSESTTDVVFGGHCMIAESGNILASSQRVGLDGCSWFDTSQATADIDLQRLEHDRQITTSWQHAARQAAVEFRVIQLQDPVASDGAYRQVSGRPFVPSQNRELHERCAEIFGIQCAGLAKRVQRLPREMPLNIGVSGGLDSTLSLLVAAKTCAAQGWPASRIAAVTMPGFGTTSRTRTAALDLMGHLQVTAEEIDIRQLCLDTYLSLKHKPFGIDPQGLSVTEFVQMLHDRPVELRQDLMFENVQARIRTMLLMNRGFVLGTGDLSEQALGWSTYNGDHMSMYNVNTSIPKTLVRFLVRYCAEHEFSGLARTCLLDVVDMPISPELLPVNRKGEIDQFTEGVLGDYELHDFFLYHMLRFGSRPRKILQLAALAKFSKSYAAQEVRATLKIFLQRFFSNQFKRSCVPDGPKVGSVSLSPRGDWRMPSDAEAAAWLSDLEEE